MCVRFVLFVERKKQFSARMKRIAMNGSSAAPVRNAKYVVGKGLLLILINKASRNAFMSKATMNT